MFLDLHVGDLIEPLTGRWWDRSRIHSEFCNRLAFFQAHGLAAGELIFIHYGNTLEFFADPACDLESWRLCGSARPPIDCF